MRLAIARLSPVLHREESVEGHNEQRHQRDVARRNAMVRRGEADHTILSLKPKALLEGSPRGESLKYRPVIAGPADDGKRREVSFS